MNGISRAWMAVPVFAFALAGCAHKGKLQGALVSPNQPSENVVFHFKSDRGGAAGGKLWTTLPDGESFSGKYVQITSTTEQPAVAPFWGGWSPYWTDWGPFGDRWLAGEDYTTFRTNYSNKAVATLFGTQGDTMRCRLNLKEPTAGLSGGGTGECQTSKRERIDIQF